MILRPISTARLRAAVFVRLQALCAFGALCALASPLAQAAFPDKPVRVVVPFSPGGGTDLVARTLAPGMSAVLGQTVIIDNKPGAGTIIGTEAVARSPADGHTMVVATFAHAINPSLQAKLPFDTDRDFAPVMLIGRGPNVLVVRADSPFRSVKDVVAAAKRDPGKLTFASQGNGTSAHLAGELFTNLAKVQLTHVPYRGAGPALTDLIGGQVDLFFGTAAAVSKHVDGGKLRALAVTSPEPAPAFRGVPTVGADIPGYVVESWYGFFVPAGTPTDAIGRLNEAARKAATSDEFRSKVEQEGLFISAGTPSELETYVKREQARWAKVVRENGLKGN